MTTPRLILASSSRYRKQLLDGLSLSCDQLAPVADEAPLPGEMPRDLSLRLALLKARSVANQIEDSDWIILGSDQVCHMKGQVYHKPGSFEVAQSHLRAFSNNWVTFSTSLVALRGSGEMLNCVEDFEIRFRPLNDVQISDYLTADEPYDCAGSIKVESLGIRLLTDTRGRDINSLYGLPVMALYDMLDTLQYFTKD